MPFQSIFHFGRSSTAGDEAATAAAKEASLNTDKSNTATNVLKTKTLEESIESAARRALSTATTTVASASKVSGANSLTQAKKTESNKLSARDLLGQVTATSTSKAPVPTSETSQRKKSVESINSGPSYKEVTTTYDAGNNSVTAATARRRSNGFYDPMAEMIPGRLYFHSIRALPLAIPDDAHVFTIDNDFNYIPFYADFGPLNIANVYRFCELLDAKMKDPLLQSKRLVMYTSSAPDKCTNAALLISSYLLMSHDKNPEEAYAPIKAREASLPLVQFRDAGYGPATYWLSVPDLLQAMQKGIKEARLLEWDNFDIEQYEFYEKVENGDLNWIIPGFFLAMATPHDEPPVHLLRYHQQVNAGLIFPLHPQVANSKRFKPLYEIHDLLSFLKANGCNGVVRLNNKLYDRTKVLDHDMDHYELFFPDGSVPQFDTIVKKFMMIADAVLPIHLINNNEAGISPEEIAKRGGLAIHCKAGLGRTGTLICCWMIKTFGWSARDCIAWCRLMRPGSVVGPQQNWLESMEERLLQWGEEERQEREKAALGLPKTGLRGAGGSRDFGSDLGLAENEGNEQLANSANGMSVPVQPNKQEREFTGTSAAANAHSYNLRGKGSNPQKREDVNQHLQQMYNTTDGVKTNNIMNMATLSIADRSAAAQDAATKYKRKVSKSSVDNPKAKSQAYDHFQSQ